MVKSKTWVALIVAVCVLTPALALAQDAKARSAKVMELTALDYFQIQQLVAKYAQYIDTC